MEDHSRVIVADIDMRFPTMVWFMVKWAFATIPALMLICLIIGSIVFILGGGLALLGSVAGGAR